jgi:hypothetical protein
MGATYDFGHPDCPTSRRAAQRFSASPKPVDLDFTHEFIYDACGRLVLHGARRLVLAVTDDALEGLMRTSVLESQQRACR